MLGQIPAHELRCCSSVGELSPVAADLRDHVLDRPSVHTRDGVETLELLLTDERAQHLLDTAAEAVDRALQALQVAQQALDQEAVVLREVPLQGLLQRWDLAAQTPLGQLRQLDRVAFSRQQRPQHGSTRLAQDGRLWRPCPT